MKIKHIMLRVYDIDKALEFYEKVLGLNLQYTRDFKDAKIYYLSKNAGDTQIALCYNFKHYEKYTHGTHFGYIGFEVDSIDAFTQKIQSMNINYEREPFVTDFGYKLAFLKDPDGHFIELIEHA